MFLLLIANTQLWKHSVCFCEWCALNRDQEHYGLLVAKPLQALPAKHGEREAGTAAEGKNLFTLSRDKRKLDNRAQKLA